MVEEETVSERRVAKVAISLDVLHDLLEMPDNAYLHAIECDFSEAFATRRCRLVIESPDLPIVSAGSEVPDIDLVAMRTELGSDRQRYIWKIQ